MSWSLSGIEPELATTPLAGMIDRLQGISPVIHNPTQDSHLFIKKRSLYFEQITNSDAGYKLD